MYDGFTEPHIGLSETVNSKYGLLLYTVLCFNSLKGVHPG